MNREFLNSTIFNLILTVVFAILISFVDLHSDEVQPAVLLLLIFSFFLGFKDPRNAWLYAILLGISIIIGYSISKLTGYVPKGPMPDSIYSSLLALIPAFIGGYAGALARNIFRKPVS